MHDSSAEALCEGFPLGFETVGDEFVLCAEQAFDALCEGGLAKTPQPTEGITYAHMLDKSEGRVRWDRSSVAPSTTRAGTCWRSRPWA